MSSVRTWRVLSICVGLALLWTDIARTTPVSAAATTTTMNYTISIADTYFNTCIGDAVLTSGTFHIVVHQVTDGQGGNHLDFEGNTVDMSGITASGTRYRVTGILRTHEDPAGSPPWVFEYTDIFNLISLDASNNFQYRVQVHTTVNANGAVTASLDNFRAVCPG